MLTRPPGLRGCKDAPTMTAALALGTAATFVWLGMVFAISFLEAPLKFRAPGVDLRIGLGIGRLVFRALNSSRGRAGHRRAGRRRTCPHRRSRRDQCPDTGRPGRRGASAAVPAVRPDTGRPGRATLPRPRRVGGAGSSKGRRVAGHRVHAADGMIQRTQPPAGMGTPGLRQYRQAGGAAAAQASDREAARAVSGRPACRRPARSRAVRSGRRCTGRARRTAGAAPW